MINILRNLDRFYQIQYANKTIMIISINMDIYLYLTV